MARYIDLDAVLAEIKRYKHKADERLKIKNRTLLEESKDIALQNLCGNLLHYVNSLEVKEVDLEKELIKWHKEHFKKNGTFIGKSGFYLTNSSQMDIAKHFFELGLSASSTKVTTPDIDDVLKENGVNPDSKEAKIIKESYFMAIEKLT